MPGLVNSAARRLLDALLPQHCALCGLASGSALPLCPDCRAEMPVNDTACTRCALPLPPAAGTGQLCGRCLARPPPFERVLAPWLYGEYLGHLIQRWKYGADPGMTPLLADLWLSRVAPEPPDLLVPVPLHWWRRWRRGFNQSELLARRLQGDSTALANCPVDTRLVTRNKPTPVQSGSSARQRARNLRGAFTVSRPCDNLRIAVIDDVLTTGATASEIAAALARAGAGRVEVWCLARTPPPGR